MKHVLLAAWFLAGCAGATEEVTIDDIHHEDAGDGGDAAPDAAPLEDHDATRLRPPFVTPTDPTIDPRACPTPVELARRYTGSPVTCVERYQACEPGASRFANDCGCGCEMPR